MSCLLLYCSALPYINRLTLVIFYVFLCYTPSFISGRVLCSILCYNIYSSIFLYTVHLVLVSLPLKKLNPYTDKLITVALGSENSNNKYIVLLPAALAGCNIGHLHLALGDVIVFICHFRQNLPRFDICSTIPYKTKYCGSLSVS